MFYVCFWIFFSPYCQVWTKDSFNPMLGAWRPDIPSALYPVNCWVHLVSQELVDVCGWRIVFWEVTGRDWPKDKQPLPSSTVNRCFPNFTIQWFSNPSPPESLYADMAALPQSFWLGKPRDGLSVIFCWTQGPLWELPESESWAFSFIALEHISWHRTGHQFHWRWMK